MTEKSLRKVLKDLQQLLSLQDWSITLHYTDDPTAFSDRCAETKYDEYHRRAAIVLVHPSLYKKDTLHPTDPRFLLLHELLHLVLHQAKWDQDLPEEVAINHLAKAFFQILY